MSRRKPDPLVRVALGLVSALGKLLAPAPKPPPAAKPATGPSTPAATAPRRNPARPRQTTAHRWPSLGEFNFPVVGESFYQGALAALAHQHGTRTTFAVLLVLDNDNPHDPQAVAVMTQGERLGHLSRQDARSYRRRLSALRLSELPATCDAQLIGGPTSTDPARSYGLLLDLKPFE